MIVGQYYTEGVLREHLARHNIHIELCTEPVSIRQDEEGVTATLKKADGDGIEQTETIRVAYVIGADGARGALML